MLAMVNADTQAAPVPAPPLSPYERRRQERGPLAPWTVTIRYYGDGADWGTDVERVRAHSETEAEDRALRRARRRFTNGRWDLFTRNVSAVRS